MIGARAISGVGALLTLEERLSHGEAFTRKRETAMDLATIVTSLLTPLPGGGALTGALKGSTWSKQGTFMSKALGVEEGAKSTWTFVGHVAAAQGNRLEGLLMTEGMYQTIKGCIEDNLCSL